MRVWVLIVCAFFGITATWAQGIQGGKRFDAVKVNKLIEQGTVEFNSKNFAAAERRYTDALGQFDGVGNQELLKATVLTNLAGAESELHQCDPAVTHLKAAIVIKEKLLGAQHASTVNSIKYLIHTLKKCGYAEKAVEMEQKLQAVGRTKDSITGSSRTTFSDVSEDQPNGAVRGSSDAKTSNMTKSGIKVIYGMTDKDKQTIAGPKYGTRQVLDHYQSVFDGYRSDAFGNAVAVYKRVPIYRDETFEIWTDKDLDYYLGVEEILRQRNLENEIPSVSAWIRQGGTVFELENNWLLRAKHDVRSDWHTGEMVVVTEHPSLGLPAVVVIADDGSAWPAEVLSTH